MPDTPSLEDFSSDPEVPEEYDDDFMIALHELSVADVEVIDAEHGDAEAEGHGSNTEEEMV